MKKLLVFVLLLLGFSAMAIAQDVPRGEIFVGYSYFGCDNKSFGQTAFEKQKLNCTYDGWNFSILVNAKSWIGLVSDFGGLYNRDNPLPRYQDHFHAYTFMWGPRFTIRNSSRVTPYAQMLFGDARVTPGKFFWPYENVWAMSIGGGVNVKAYKNFSFRPFQLEYMTVKLGKAYSDNIRYTAGISYNFGSIPK
jgi:hypothetical protein